MTRSWRYILNDDGQPVECDDLMTWAHWHEENFNKRCVILQDRWHADPHHEIMVSTVFLALSMQGTGNDLFETMVFAHELPIDQSQWRWANRETALKAHQFIVDALYAEPGYKPQPREIEGT